MGLDVDQVVVLAGPPSGHPCLVRYQTQDASWGRGGGECSGRGQGCRRWGQARRGQLSPAEVQPWCWQAEEGFLSHALPSIGIHFFFFLVAPHSMQDLSSLARDRSPHPLNWQHEVLTTGPLGKSRPGFILEGWLS